MSHSVTTRFAPSPTGYLHVGNLRTALMNYLVARKAGGTFILRLDDTDPERSKQEYADAIMADLDWLGLHWDRIEHQFRRAENYRAAADKLRKADRFYECFESPTELDLKRRKQLSMGHPPVYDRASLALDEGARSDMRAEGRKGYWRFLLHRQRIEWTDGIIGPVSIDAASVSDPVLIRADGQVLYTLASSVDDIEMGVTHIVRGADHVTNTATQIQIMQALGGPLPSFAHHSLLTGAEGEELSKRLGTLSLRDLRAQGVEPMALLSLLARLGSSHPVELARDLDELAEGFDIASFGTSPTRFDPEELRPLNRHLVQNLGFSAVAARVAALGIPDDQAERFWQVARENITILDELAQWSKLCLEGASPVIADEDRDFIRESLALLPPRPWSETTWKEWTEAVRAATGRKGRGLFMPLRKALTGQEEGPDMAHLLPLLHRVHFI